MRRSPKEEQERRRSNRDLAARLAKLARSVSSSGVRASDPDEEVVKLVGRSSAPARRSFLGSPRRGDDED